MSVRPHAALRELHSVIFAAGAWSFGCAASPQTATRTQPPATVEQRDEARSTHSDTLGPAPVPSSEERSSIDFSLHAHATDLRRGSVIWFAARFALPPGAHIYWTNPGETGLATTVRFEAPPSLSINEVRYPGPRRFAGLGGSVGYGYEGRFAVVARAVVNTTVDSLDVAVDASWLSCGDVCAREVEHRSLHLDAQNATRISDLDALLGTLPKPAADEIDEVAWLTPHSFRLTTKDGLTPLEFFPHAPLGPDDRDCLGTADPNNRALTVQLRSVHSLRPTAGLVLTRDGGGMLRYLDVVIR